MKMCILSQLAMLLLVGSAIATPFLETPLLKIVYGNSTQADVENAVAELQGSGKTFITALEQELDAQHDNFLLELQATFATQEEWDAVLCELETLRAQDELLLAVDASAEEESDKDYSLIAKARTIMKEAGINPEVVEINLVRNPKRITGAAAGQGYDGQNMIHDLEINLDQMEKYPEDEQKAILRHEMVHLLKYDGLEQAAIEAMFERNNILPEQYSKHPTYVAYCRFQEYRADLLSSPNVALALATLKNLARLIKMYPEFCKKDSIRHPSIVKRHDAVSSHISYLQAEQKQLLLKLP